MTMTKYLALAILVTGFLAGDAYGENYGLRSDSEILLEAIDKLSITKDILIADVYFDDGSVLHNVKITTHEVRVKHEGEYFNLGYRDLKSINFDVQPGTSDITRCATGEVDFLGNYDESCGTIGKEAIVTLKIKTKIGVEVTDRFSTGGERGCSGLGDKHVVKVISKLTGKKISRTYRITNLKISTFDVIFVDALGMEHSSYSSPGCIFHKGKRKAISSIVFKDG